MNFDANYPPFHNPGGQPAFGVMPVHGSPVRQDAGPPVRRAFNLGEAQGNPNPPNPRSGASGSGTGLKTPAKRLDGRTGPMGAPEGGPRKAALQVENILSPMKNGYFVFLGRVGFYLLVLAYDILQIGIGWFGLGGCLVRRTQYQWYSNRSPSCTQRMAMLCMSLSPLVWLLALWSFGFPFFILDEAAAAPESDKLQKMMAMMQQIAQSMGGAAGTMPPPGGDPSGGSGGAPAPSPQPMRRLDEDDVPFLQPFGKPSDIGLALIVAISVLVAMELTSSFFDPITKLWKTCSGTFCPSKKSPGGEKLAANPTAAPMNDIKTLVWFGGNIFLLDEKNLQVIVNLQNGAPPYGILLRQAMFMCMAGVAGLTTYLCADQIRVWSGLADIANSEIIEEFFPGLNDGPSPSGHGIALTTIVSSLITAYLPFRIILYTIIATWQGTATEQGLKDAPLTRCINSALLSVAGSGDHSAKPAPPAPNNERAPMMPQAHAAGGLNMQPIHVL